MIVAIDGPAGVGKSSIAKNISLQCGFYYVNSGNYYRAIVLEHLNNDRDPFDEMNLINTAETVEMHLKGGRLFLNGNDVEDLLHTDQIDVHVARISAIIPIRKIVNKALRISAEFNNIIVEGRDITTVVFPQADLKFYFDASIEIRAKRRYKQQDTMLSLNEIEQEIEKRDKIDKSKTFGALMVSDDASYIDTSYLTIDEVCEKVVQKIKDLR